MPAGDTLNWLDSYYEALEFFYWEPQHIGRKKHPTAQVSIDKVVKRLRNMEVTLNQNIHQFFLLAPVALRKHLFEHAFARAFAGPFALHGRNVDIDFRLSNSVQPDLLFTSDAEIVSIEMKLGAKCTVSQVLKYALLGLAAELRVDRPLTHHFLLLGSGGFSNQWRETFGSTEDLRIAIAAADLSEFMRRQPAHFRPSLDRLRQIVSEMRLAFMDYQCLAAFLREALPEDADQSPGAEVYRNLTLGIVDELRRRQLAT